MSALRSTYLCIMWCSTSVCMQLLHSLKRGLVTPTTTPTLTVAVLLTSVYMHIFMCGGCTWAHYTLYCIVRCVYLYHLITCTLFCAWIWFWRFTGVCVCCVCVCVCVCEREREREREREWKDAELVPLDKKGDRMKCEISVGSPSSACQGRRCPWFYWSILRWSVSYADGGPVWFQRGLRRNRPDLGSQATTREVTGTLIWAVSMFYWALQSIWFRQQGSFDGSTVEVWGPRSHSEPR